MSEITISTDRIQIQPEWTLASNEWAVTSSTRPAWTANTYDHIDCVREELFAYVEKRLAQQANKIYDTLKEMNNISISREEWLALLEEQEN